MDEKEEKSLLKLMAEATPFKEKSVNIHSDVLEPETARGLFQQRSALRF